MRDHRSPLTIVLLAIALILAAFAIIVILSAPVFGQEAGRHAAPQPTLTDADYSIDVSSFVSWPRDKRGG